jgi:uncharacterized membrane protein
MLHRLFQAGVLLKGVDGLLEVAGGLLFLCVSQAALTRVVFSLTRPELLEDPDDLIAHGLRDAFAHMSAGSKLFAAVYLLGHGLVKLILVAGLWRDRLWAFPIALVVLIGFIGYQAVRLGQHGSIGLLSLTVIDVFIAALIWIEYRRVSRPDNRGSR